MVDPFRRPSLLAPDTALSYADGKIDWKELVKNAQLRTTTSPEDVLGVMTPKEQSIIEDIIDSPAVQVRLKNFIFEVILSQLTGKLKFIPFKHKILEYAWGFLNEGIDKFVEVAKAWRDKRKADNS